MCQRIENPGARANLSPGTHHGTRRMTNPNNAVRSTRYSAFKSNSTWNVSLNIAIGLIQCWRRRQRLKLAIYIAPCRALVRDIPRIVSDSGSSEVSRPMPSESHVARPGTTTFSAFDIRATGDVKPRTHHRVVRQESRQMMRGLIVPKVRPTVSWYEQSLADCAPIQKSNPECFGPARGHIPSAHGNALLSAYPSRSRAAATGSTARRKPE